MFTHSSDCIFCKIITKDAPSKIIHETDWTLVIANIYPQAPIHYLLLPKKHIIDMSALSSDDAPFMADMTLVTTFLSKNCITPGTGFNIVSNNGASAGQSIFHLHWHFLSGKNLYADGGLKL